jgi:hypothetical protein
MTTYMETLSIEELIAEEIAEGVLPCKIESSRRKLVVVFMEP